MLTFLVGSKQAFEVSLTDIAQTQLQGKNDVYMEFHVDDTTGANEVVYTLNVFHADFFSSFFFLLFVWRVSTFHFY